MTSFKIGKLALKSGSLLTLISGLVLTGSLIVPTSAFAVTPPALLYVGTPQSGTGDGSQANPFATIQQAVDAAAPAPGSTIISVAAGTYDAFEVNGKTNLTITGAGNSTVVAPTTLIDTHTGHKYTSDMQVSVFVNNSTGISISDMEVEGNGTAAPGAGGPDALVFWNASTGSLDNDTVMGTYAINGGQTGQGIAVDAGNGQTTTLAVSDDAISGFQKNGIDIVDGNSSTSNPGTISVTVSGGSITGAGSTGLIAQNGILTWNNGGGNVSATVDGTNISDFDYTGNDQATGILNYGTATIPTISNVTFSNDQIYIENAATASIDATTGNTFDSVSPSSASGTQLAGIENKMYDVMEDNTVGPVYLLPNTLIATIDPGNRGVQGGAASAVSGDTVLVTPGTYTGDVILPASNDVTLEGIGNPVINLGAGYGINLDNNVAVTNFTFEGFTVNAYDAGGSPSNNTTYAFKAYKADGLTLSNDTFNGGAGNTGGGVDINTTNNVMLSNVTSTGFYKNGFADTSRYAAGDTAANGITFNNVTANDNGYGGISFYTSNNAGTIEGSINGVQFTGTNTISDNTGPGIFVEGDTDANFHAHNTPANTVTTDGTTLDLTHVAFNGNAAYDIINYQTAPVNAIGATFESLTGDQMTNAQITTQDSKIFDQLDLPALGLVTYHNPDVTVTIDKFIDGSMATAASANGASFPMKSSWVTNNFGSGSGTYTLGPTGFNSPNAYEAVTSEQNSGSSYTTQEDTTQSEVGASCSDGKPFALAGYTTGATAADAAAGTPSLTVPNLTNITSNEYIDVWNVTCPSDTTAPTVTVTPVAGSALSGTVTFNITVSDNNPLDPTKNTNVWVYLYDNGGTQKSKGASVDLSSGSGTFTVDTTQLDNGLATLDVGIVYDAAGNPSGASDNYFKDYTIDNGSPAPTPSVVTDPAANVTNSDATLTGTIGPVGADNSSFWVSTSTIDTSNSNIPAGVYSTQVLGQQSAGANFTASLSSLVTSAVVNGQVDGTMPAITPNTTYYYVAWGLINGNWVHGDVESFTTGVPTPSVTTNAATSITDTGATVNGTDGPVNADSTSFWWGPGTGGPFTPGADPASNQLPNGWSHDSGLGGTASGGSFNEALTNLAANTTYSFVAWVEVGGTWYPGNVLTFTTGASASPSVTTNAASSVTDTSATVNGTNGSVDADNTSFWWGPSTAGPFTAAADPSSEFPAGWSHDSGLGAATAGSPFNEPLTGLTTNTAYSFVAWVEVGGTWYPGDVLTFTPSAAPVTDPTVPTNGAPNTTLSSGNFSFSWDASTGSSPITYEFEDSTSNATNPDGSFTNQLVDDANLTDTTLASPNTPDGTYYWHVRAMDTNGTSAWSDTWTVVVNSNQVAPPTATAQTVNVPENGSADITLQSTSDAQPVTYATSTSPAHGTLGAITDGAVTYTPDAGYSGADSFDFTATAGNQTSAAATVSINVIQTPDQAPVVTDIATTTTEGTATNITLTGTDADNDTLTFATTSSPTNGTLTGSGANLVYTPNAGFTGSDSFTFVANDGQENSNTGKVTITVNAAPQQPTTPTVTPEFAGFSGGFGGSGGSGGTSGGNNTPQGHGGQVLGASTYNFTKDLHVGSTGPDVVALQQFLIDEGYSIPAGATGYFGQQTRSALAAYQAANGISPAAGYFGPITRALVNKGEVPTTTG